MSLYRFSPIKNASECQTALEYIQANLRKLSALVIAEELPINTLKIFAHYEEEYVFLKTWIDEQGAEDGVSSPTSYYVRPHSPLTINGDPIEYLGLRIPDPYRGQVGCGDYVVEDYEHFVRTYLGKTPYIRKVEHPVYEMLELFHPDYDVLGYIVKKYD